MSDVPLVAVTLTWREASSSARARAADPSPELLAGLRNHGVAGLVELHTCARSLWLANAEQAAWVGALLESRVDARVGIPPVLHIGEDAARHVLRVVVGLDSYAQGEADIGGQVLSAFDGARVEGHTSPTMNLLQQAAARLVAEGRERGFVRQNRGLAAQAVAALVARGIDLRRVGVIGSGSIGTRAVASLRNAGGNPTIYNRSPGPGVLPLTDLATARHDAMIVCTAGPARWLKLPHCPLVIDLGLPTQVADQPGLIGLDELLAGDPLKLSPALVRAAEDAVEREIGGLMARIRTAGWQRGLAGAHALRDRFLDEELDGLLAPATADLTAEQQRKVRDAARSALRQYNHRVLTWIKHDLDPNA